MYPFSIWWFGFLGMMTFVGVGLYHVLRHRPDRVQRRTLALVAAGSVVLYTAFTFKSINNPALPEVTLGQNLPFHLCNVVAWCLIPAYLLDERRWPRTVDWLRAFCFFPGALAGFLALTSPVPIYIGQPLISLETIGFYGVHSMNVVLGTLLASLGLYRPSLWHALRSALHLLALATIVFPLDIVMRALVDPGANYFYLFDPEDADILVAAHDVLPVPYLYALLLAPVALSGVVIQLGLYRGIEAIVGRVRPRPTALVE